MAQAKSKQPQKGQPNPKAQAILGVVLFLALSTASSATVAPNKMNGGNAQASVGVEERPPSISPPLRRSQPNRALSVARQPLAHPRAL